MVYTVNSIWLHDGESKIVKFVVFITFTDHINVFCGTVMHGKKQILIRPIMVR